MISKKITTRIKIDEWRSRFYLVVSKLLRLRHEILEYFFRECDSETIKSVVMILRCNHAHFVNRNKYVLLKNSIQNICIVFECLILYFFSVKVYGISRWDPNRKIKYS